MILWIDIETTGLKASINGIIQLACIIEDDENNIVDEILININPDTYGKIAISYEALVINGKTENEIKTYTHSKIAIKEFIDFIYKNVPKGTQFQLAGYNTPFDRSFIMEWFKYEKIPLYPIINYKDLDVLVLVRFADYYNLIPKTENHKLGTMCRHFNIPILEHNALSDIKATYELSNKIKGLLNA